MAAVDFLSVQEDVDSDKIGIIGICGRLTHAPNIEALFLQYSSYFSHCRKGLTGFVVFCLSIFVGKRDETSSGIGCRSPSFPI